MLHLGRPVHTCKYASLHVCVHANVCLYVCMHVGVWVCSSENVCMHVCVHVLHEYVCVREYVRA